MSQITPDDVGRFVMICLLFASVIIGILNYTRTQKRQVSFETEYATRQEVEQVRADVQVVDGKVETLTANIVSNGESRRVAIESKVEDVGRESRKGIGEVKTELASLASGLAELKGETKIITQQLARMEMRSGRTGI
jgi:hypothetical protein